jgi:hypothetical protein
MEIVLFEKDFSKIIYEEEQKLLSQIWLRPVTSAEYRESFSKVLEIIQEKKVPLFLSDTSMEGIISPEDRQWLEQEMIPKAVVAGLKYSATILNPDAFKKYYLKKIKSKSEESGMKFRIFGDREEGRKWLLSQKI